ncbi:MAG: glycerophosphodiester phosphodiesterase [Sphaerochaeta sp.]
MKQVFTRPLLFGHRGSSIDHAENTLSSFAECLQHGIDGIELDVQRCKSGELVVIHDYDLQRVASLPLKVAECSYGELRQIDVGGGESIPLLEDVFALGGENLFYDIEIKSPGIQDIGVEALLFSAITSSSLKAKCFVSSFNPVSLLRFKHIAKDSIPTGLIYAQNASVPKILHHGFGRHLAHPTYLKPVKEQVEKALSLGYQLCPWTVDDRGEAKKLLSLGVKGIISNNPKALQDLFNV